MKLCFVIMGFGKKTDYSSGRTIDLDKTYLNIIKPAVESSGYRCIRADEVKDSGLIDKSMYALLLYSDLVIADISTYNPNALYELGIRHAVRPYSTIIMKEEQGKIPFDIDHNRLFIYRHLGEDIGKSEAERCQESLKSIIKNVNNLKAIDSPLYEYFSNIQHPSISEEEFNSIISNLADQEEFLFAIVTKANKCKVENDFSTAYKYWLKAIENAPNETYFIQQAALCKYKSREPSVKSALIDSLGIINPLLDESNDPETLGIAGAINKNLHIETDDVEFLERAIESYGKGYQVRGDYYNGENYALCLNMMQSIELDSDQKTYYKIEAKKTRESIIKSLLEIIEMEENEEREDKRWIYATLSNCYYGVGNTEQSNIYEKKFRDETQEQWEVETFDTNLQILKSLLVKE